MVYRSIKVDRILEETGWSRDEVFRLARDAKAEGRLASRGSVERFKERNKVRAEKEDHKATHRFDK